MPHLIFQATLEAEQCARRKIAAAFFQQCRKNATLSTTLNRGFIRNPGSAAKSTGTIRSTTRAQVPNYPPVSPTRLFSTTASTRATIAKLNPRQDDDGKDMTIEISERAAKRLRQITSAPRTPNSLTKSSNNSADSHLRVTVTSGGCHGFQYLMSLEGESKIDQEEDTVFVPADEAGEGHAEVVMDSASLELLKGSTIDYTTELIGSQFKIVGNPRAKSSCGCGTSFDIE